MLSLNRYLGSMLGLAVGDALGMPVEFCPVDTTDPIREMRPAVRFDGISREEIELPAGTTGGPMTYMNEGKQYLSLIHI